MLRRRFKNILSFPGRLEQEAMALKDQAREMRPSKQREIAWAFSAKVT